MNRWMRRGAALGTAVALGLGLTGCSGGAEGTASTVKETFTSYVSAINAGDYAKALTFVDDAKGATADNIVRLSDSEIPEPLIKGEEPSKDVESADVDFTVGSTEPKVSFVKRDGGWKLKNPALVEAYDLEETAGDLLTGLTQIADVSLKSPTGQTMPAKGFVVKDGGSPSEAPQITVALAGKYGLPDQEIKEDLDYKTGAGYQIDSYSLIGHVDTSALEKVVASEMRDKMVWKGNYVDSKSPHVHIQSAEITEVSDCGLALNEKTGQASASDADGLLYLDCAATHAQTATDGSDLLNNSGEWGAPYTANGETCVSPTVVKREGTSAGSQVIQLKDGKLTVLWDTETVSPTRYQVGAFCGSPDIPVDEVIAGVVPKSGETPDTTVSDDLASLVSKAL